MPAYSARRLIILFLLLIQCYNTWTQPLQFTKFQQEHFVTTIFQDSHDFMWLGTPAGLFRYDGYHFKNFQHDETDTTSLSNNVIWNIVEDNAGHIWVGTENGLNRLDPRREVFTRIKSDFSKPDALSNDLIVDLLADTAGTVWVATANGLNRYLPPLQHFKRYLHEPKPADDRPFRPSRTPIQTRKGTIWVGVQDTLYRYEPATDRFVGIRLPGNDAVANFIRLIYEDDAGYLWIGTQLNGAFRFDPYQLAFPDSYKNTPGDANSLSHNTVSAFIQNGDELWIGTTGGGLNVLNLKTGNILRYTGNPPDPFGVNSETIRDAWEDNRGNIWLGSYYDGLYQFKHNQRIFRHFNQYNGLLSKKVNDIDETADGKIWIAMGTGGLAVFDPERNGFTNYYQNESGNTNGLPSGNLNRIRKDETGQLWVASHSGGISRFDPERGRFEIQLPSRPDDLAYLDFLTDFWVEENGDIWIARQTGLVKYVQENQSFKSYLLPDKENTTIKYGNNNFVTSIYRDRQGQLWFTTYGGLNRYEPETDSFTFFPSPYRVLQVLETNDGTFWTCSDTKDGSFIFDREKQAIFKVLDVPGIPLLEDGQGQVWLYNSDYVIRYDPAENTTTLLGEPDGLNGGFYWTAHLAATGNVFLGGIEGLTIFNPDSLQGVSPPPRVVLTGFRLFNRTVPLQGGRSDTLDWESPLSQSITFTERINLKYWQNYFSLEFAALDLTAPTTNRYKYKLEGYDQDWVATAADQRLVTYTNLDPGHYTFRVQGAARNGDWNETGASLQIHILPPWWRNWWAYLAYALIAFLLIRTLYVFQLRRRLAQGEAERYKELDAAKNRLFTNITHEFRTPLTVILGMAQQIKTEPSVWLAEGVDAITRNGHQLLKLVNQMLDLSRLEAHSMPVHYQQGDVMAYLAYLIESFQSYAAMREVELKLIRQPEHLNMDFDPELLAKASNNLLSNALKFTPAGGRVQVRLEQVGDQLSLSVKDNGIGIPPEHLPHIFDRFFQAENAQVRGSESTGIGLALVRELAAMMEGKISVSSESGVSTIFRMLLPIRNQAPAWSGDFAQYAVVWEEDRLSRAEQEEADVESPLVLIIEDNEDVARYTAACLQADYRIALAENGRIGLEKALELTPDMIICDIMMPEIDGYEVCKTLKEDERTSHIPVIMLTARVDDPSRIEGLRHGADAYLAKPFNREELEVRLATLIEIRRRLWEKYASFPVAGSEPSAETDREDAFLQKLRKLVLDHLDEEGFRIAEICLEMAVSRSQLHRKIKALTGRSTSHVVNAIRLQKAKELLLQTNLTIAEVAYSTGFKTGNYFSQVFQQEFGQSPSYFRAHKS